MSKLLKVYIYVGVRFRELTKSIPDDLKNTWYCQKVVRRLEKYGRVGVPFSGSHFIELAYL